VLGDAEPLHGLDVPVREHGDRCDAGIDRLAVDHHDAGAALPEAAAELRAIELQVLAQHVEERRRAIGLDLAHLAVHIELHGGPFEIFLTSPATSFQAGWPESARR